MNTWHKILQYCTEHSSSQDSVLYELERISHLKTLAPQMISGAYQGQLLTMLSTLMQPSYILEIGTYTGYSAICLARGLRPNGKLHTFEVNDELAYISREYFAKAGLEDCIIAYQQDAMEVIPQMEEGIDLVLIDGAKLDYALHYKTVLPKVRKGGILLADNVLWSGKVVSSAHDTDTKGIRAFNEMVAADDSVDQVILPIRDGLTVIMKK